MVNHITADQLGRIGDNAAALDFRPDRLRLLDMRMQDLGASGAWLSSR